MRRTEGGGRPGSIADSQKARYALWARAQEPFWEGLPAVKFGDFFNFSVARRSVQNYGSTADMFFWNVGCRSRYFRHLGNLLMRIMDGFMAFPSIILAIALMAALGATWST